MTINRYPSPMEPGTKREILQSAQEELRRYEHESATEMTQQKRDLDISTVLIAVLALTVLVALFILFL